MIDCATRLARRSLMTGAALGLALPPLSALAQTPSLSAPSAAVLRITAAFARGAQPLDEGLKLQLPVLGDNPASVPVRAMVTLPMNQTSFCEAMIIIAEGNPKPLACSFTFSPHAGMAEIGVRLRLTQSQIIQAMARMNDGRILVARQHISVTAGSYGF